MEDKNYTIEIYWNVDDILSLDDTLTIEECIEVLDLAQNNHDANYGINWDTLKGWIEYIKEVKETI
jgi:hypothetical protein